MADFTNVEDISNNIQSAKNILRIFKNIYAACIEVEGILERYNTDLAFKAEADHLFTPEQLGELGVMINDVQSFRLNWETNHSGALI